jgi:hypothetical protein
LRIRPHALALALAALLAAPAAFAGPQGDVQSVSPPVKSKQTKPKLDRYKGRVLVFDKAHLIVQSTVNEKMVWSFQYAPDYQSKVTDMLNTGGYQNGDMVTVFTNPGTTVVVKIKGKASKPQ